MERARTDPSVSVRGGRLAMTQDAVRRGKQVTARYDRSGLARPCVVTGRVRAGKVRSRRIRRAGGRAQGWVLNTIHLPFAKKDKSYSFLRI